MAEAPTHAVMFKVGPEGKGVFYVMANGRVEHPNVVGFVSCQEGLDSFESQYGQAIARGHGWSAGAMLHWMTLRPRVFCFREMPVLEKLLGETVYPHRIEGTGVHETAFKCVDQEAAAKVYEEAVEPRLVHA